MKLGIMQPYFFPYIGYWQLLNLVDTYVVYDDVNYINRGWINRNRILINRQPQYFNIRMQAASQNKLINEISIINETEDRQKLFHTLESNYKKAPFYYETMDLISKILNNPQKNLAFFLYDQIQIIADYLYIDTKLILSSNLDKDNTLKGESKILSICNLLGAEEYYNAIGGQKLYNKDRFLAENIKLKFIETEDIRYKQFEEDFFSNMSIVDVMMFNSRNDICGMLEKCRIIE